MRKNVEGRVLFTAGAHSPCDSEGPPRIEPRLLAHFQPFFMLLGEETRHKLASSRWQPQLKLLADCSCKISAYLMVDSGKSFRREQISLDCLPLLNRTSLSEFMKQGPAIS
jgi:hypothetical protein